jgi:hypothetical protein
LIKPQFAAMPASTRQPCLDPGVPPAIETVPEAVDALAAHRLWAVCTEKKRAGAVRHFDRVVAANR